jgi:flagellar FliL protein
MAKKQAEKDTQAETEAGGGKKKLIFIILGVVLLIGVSVGATVMLLGGGDTTEAEVDPGPVKDDPSYVELKPFTVNLAADDKVGFLQTEVQILTYFDDVAEQLEKHKPLIRNNLTVLFAQQQSAALRSSEGKTALQQKVLESVQDAINKYGKGGEVDSVFFTAFVMQ